MWLLPLLILPLPVPARVPLSARHALERRSALSGSLTDANNLVYSIAVTLNDVPLSIMIDTGSSDFWVSSSVPGAVSQDFQAAVSYASGSASGNVMSATLDLAGFSVPQQFFIEAPGATAAASADGLIGLGPSAGSSIRQLDDSPAANPPLDRIFTSNASVSSYIAILLQRSNDPGDPYPGDLAVGDVLSDHQDILDQPRHPVSIASLSGGQHWQTFLDVDGIIGPDGKPIQIKTQVTGAQTRNATVVFDTGFSLPQVPSYVAEALYGDIPGAALVNVSNIGEIWTLPCDQEVNATFLFGGVEFPIHPLDMNFDEFSLEEDGKPLCVGAFQPYSFDIVQDGEVLFDFILGMAFLRNAYILINFGNLVNAATPSTDTAYIQLLPVTNATQAAQDFAEVRGSSETLFSSGSTRSKSSLSPWEIGLIAGAGLLLILLIVGVVRCCCGRRNKNIAPSGTVWPANLPAYRPIHEPSPQAAYDMHMPSGAPPGYTPAHAPEYRTAWDARR